MEVLELDGKRFLKASSAARDLGYTADYVGQLCRSGKIDAHLVGRSWYVEEESIRGHKASRYRSSKEKTKQAFKVAIHKQTEEYEQVQTRSGAPHKSSKPTHHFYTKLTPKTVKYDEDASELIPILTEKKPTNPVSIEVKTAGAESVSVKKASKPYALKATELPKIRFSGDVTVEAATEDVDAPEAAVGPKMPQEKVTKLEVEDTSQKVRKSPKNGHKTMTEHKMHRRTLHPVDETPKEEIVRVQTKGIRVSSPVVRGEGDFETLTISRAPTRRPSRLRARFAVLATGLVAVPIALATVLTVESITSDMATGAQTATFMVDLSQADEVIERLKSTFLGLTRYFN